MRTLKEIEDITIITRLMACKFNITGTAKSLGIGVRTMQRKLHRLGYEPVPGGVDAKQQLQAMVNKFMGVSDEQTTSI
jgi:hypothetical protein